MDDNAFSPEERQCLLDLLLVAFIVAAMWHIAAEMFTPSVPFSNEIAWFQESMLGLGYILALTGIALYRRFWSKLHWRLLVWWRVQEGLGILSGQIRIEIESTKAPR